MYDLPTVGLRYFNVFGPRQYPESQYAAVISRFIAAVLHGESLEVHGDGRRSRDFTHVRNVAAANCPAAGRAEAVGEVVNVACGRQSSLMDIIQILGRELPDVTPPIHWHHAPVRAGDVRHTRADLTKAAHGLGYHAVVGFEGGLRDTLAVGRREVVRTGLLDAPHDRGRARSSTAATP